VREMMQSLINEPEIRKEGYKNGCDISCIDNDQWSVNYGEIYGYVDLKTRQTHYNAEEINGLKCDCGSYEDIRNSIVNANEEDINNSRYAAEWNE
jgi:hypothetical protein